jgi:hypothetical protein
LFGSNWTRRIKFQNPIQWGKDDFEFNVRQKSTGKICAATEVGINKVLSVSNNFYGYSVVPVIGDNYTADLVLYKGGYDLTGATYGANGGAFSLLNADYEWFVKKTSAGKPGETLPLVRAVLKYAVPQSTAGVISFNTILKDTNSIINVGKNRITANCTGVFKIDVCLVTAPTTNIQLYKNGSFDSYFMYNTSSVNAQDFGGTTVDLNAGEYIELILIGGQIVSDASTYFKVTLLGR